MSMSWPSCSAVIRNPVDVVMVDVDNNNQADANQGEENRVEDVMIVEAQAQVVIGVPDPDYDIHKSVFYTHKFYKKIIKEDGSAVAKCLVCWEKNKEKEVFLKVTDNNTKGLIGHIDSFHPSFAKKWRELKVANDEKKSRSSRKRFKGAEEVKKQTKLLAGTNKTLQLEQRIDADLQRRYDEGRVMFCAKTFTAFNAMQHDHILVKALLPNSHKYLENKSPKTISIHTSRKADQIRRDMLSILLSAKETTKSFGFSSDLSKTKNMFSLISLTVHFPAPDGELVKLVLHSDYFGENRHTGTNILFSLQSMMTECGLDGDDISRYIVLDNASNNKRAMNLGSDKFEVIWCVIHTLQLAIKDALKVKLGQMSVGRVLDKCRDTCTLVRRSESNRDALKQACASVQINFVLPKKPMEVRWNSVDNNVASILRLQEALLLLSFRDRGGEAWSETVPTERQFQVAEAVHKCLEPLKIATKRLESDTEPTLHLVVKELYNVKIALEDEIRSSRYVKMFASNLLKNVEKRYKDSGTRNKLLSIAHYLDPDTRGLVLKQYPGAFERTMEDIRIMCLKYDTDPAPVQVREELGDGDAEVAERNLSGIERLKRRSNFGDVNRTAPAPVPLRGFEYERQIYERKVDVDKNYSNPIKWFIRNKETYPILSQLALEVLSIPASSASSERAFSVATRMCSDSRHRLSAQKISDLMIINLNYDAVESYKSKYGLTKSYGGQLLRLVDIDFPLWLDVDEEPPEYDVPRVFVDDEVVEDNYEMREVTDSDDSNEESEDE